MAVNQDEDLAPLPVKRHSFRSLGEINGDAFECSPYGGRKVLRRERPKKMVEKELETASVAGEQARVFKGIGVGEGAEAGKGEVDGVNGRRYWW